VLNRTHPEFVESRRRTLPGTNVQNFGAEVAFCSPPDWLARPIQNAI
jgi:hypothetical protein